MLHDINFGYFITLVLYSIPLIGRVIYLDCMKYHSITIGGGGVNIMRKGTFRSQAYFSDGTF